MQNGKSSAVNVNLRYRKKVQKNGIKVTEVIGDMAYVSDDNLEACGKEIALIARTNTAVAAAANGKLEEGFCFNKDAGMLQVNISKRE